MEKEYRKLNELRSLPEGRVVEGYALVFDEYSEDLGGFTEIIDRNAIGDAIERSDVFALLNHSSDRGVLARSKNGKGSLTLKVDDRGLYYSFEAPATALGDELLEYIKRGDITASSFAFTVRKDKWEKVGDSYKRTILEFDRLFDVSPVFSPAYNATEVKCKRFNEVLEEEKIQMEEELRKQRYKELLSEFADLLISEENYPKKID